MVVADGGPLLRRVLEVRLTNAARLRALRILLSCGLVAGILLSAPLWLTDRDFPLLPRFSFVPALPYPLDVLALVAALALTFAIAVRAEPHLETAALAVLMLALIAQDHTRCQPWLYQYVLMLLVAVPLRAQWRAEAVRLDTLGLLMAAVYAWSGVQKVNRVFFSDTGPWLLEPFGDDLSRALAFLRYAFPAVEIAVGIGVLLPRTRQLALGLGIVMHLLILYVIGPFGHDVNSVVWPWNVVMIGLLWVLFRGTAATAIRLHASAPPRVLRWAIICAFWVLPALSFARLWSTDLSGFSARQEWPTSAHQKWTTRRSRLRR